MATKKDTSSDVVTSDVAGSTPLGDHTAADLLDSYSEAKNKPSPDSIAQEQTPPEGWPGTVRGGAGA